jgi:hypothetical protein
MELPVRLAGDCNPWVSKMKHGGQYRHLTGPAGVSLDIPKCQTRPLNASLHEKCSSRDDNTYFYTNHLPSCFSAINTDSCWLIHNHIICLCTCNIHVFCFLFYFDICFLTRYWYPWNIHWFVNYFSKNASVLADSVSISSPFVTKNRMQKILVILRLYSGLQIDGVLAYFTYLKCQKRIGDDVGDLKYVFTKKKRRNLLGWKLLPDTFYPTYYARIWLQMP